MIIVQRFSIGDGVVVGFEQAKVVIMQKTNNPWFNFWPNLNFPTNIPSRKKERICAVIIMNERSKQKMSETMKLFSYRPSVGNRSQKGSRLAPVIPPYLTYIEADLWMLVKAVVIFMVEQIFALVSSRLKNYDWPFSISSFQCNYSANLLSIQIALIHFIVYSQFYLLYD